MQPVDNMDVVLSVEQIGRQLAVRPRFENRSEAPIYVLQGTFGIGALGPAETNPMPMSENEYLITRDEIPLQYRGQYSYVVGAPTQDEFIPIAPKQVVATRYDRIDDAYRFEPGTHEYKIIHRHFQLDRKTGEIKEHHSRETKFSFTYEATEE